MINRAFFFEHVRATLFTGRLSQAQVDGLTFILDCWHDRPDPKDDCWLAYALATAFHEAGFKMQPVREKGGPSYFFRMYDPDSPEPSRGALARKMKALPGDGIVYYGRGYVQLTWRANYAKMGHAFNVDLTSGAAPADAALKPDLAAKIMFKGMAEGSFTGRRLGQYFDAPVEDWRNARRIINGLDCAETIAGYAKKFYASISYTV